MIRPSRTALISVPSVATNVPWVNCSSLARDHELNQWLDTASVHWEAESVAAGSLLSHLGSFGWGEGRRFRLSCCLNDCLSHLVGRRIDSADGLTEEFSKTPYGDIRFEIFVFRAANWFERLGTQIPILVASGRVAYYIVQSLVWAA